MLVSPSWFLFEASELGDVDTRHHFAYLVVSCGFTAIDDLKNMPRYPCGTFAHVDGYPSIGV